MVQDGLFAFHLACNYSAGYNNRSVFTGQSLWLEVSVRPDGSGPYTTLPRQPISPTPYAWSLYPGAVISGTLSGDGFGRGAINAWNEDGIGVFGHTGGGTASDAGVYGEGAGTANGVYGHQLASTSGLGVYGKNEGGGSGVSGYNPGDGNGTWGYSGSHYGVAGMTGRGDNNYGFHTLDNLYSDNFHSMGATMQVALNGGSEHLERGDVVVITGLGAAAVEGSPPIVQVGKAREAGSTAVIGVVYSTFSEAWLLPTKDPTGATGPEERIPLAQPGPIAPGEYLLVVVRGPCLVKADAFGAAIQAGDLLSTAGRAGYATAASTIRAEGASFAAPGAVLGKALEPLGTDRVGLIYVYVTLE
jgi:hypothetical protein